VGRGVLAAASRPARHADLTISPRDVPDVCHLSVLSRLSNALETTPMACASDPAARPVGAASSTVSPSRRATQSGVGTWLDGRAEARLLEQRGALDQRARTP
jgi:hypothetical protein